MADEVRDIAQQLTRLFKGPSWLGPSVHDVLHDINEDQAQARPLPHAHSIWELVLHCTTWLRIARERLHAFERREPTASENWPEPKGSWNEAISSLYVESEALAEAILSFPSHKLQAMAPAEEEQTYFVLLHGVVQHTAYHLGQIALLKRAFA